MGLFQKLFRPGFIPVEEASYAALGVDLHSHFIPGVDDGAETMEHSLEMLAGMQRLGFRKVVTTPHVMMDSYKNTPEIILTGLQNLRKAVTEKGLSIQVEAGAEYMVDDGFEKIISDKTFLTFSNKYILIELSTFMPHPNLKNMIFQLQLEGYKVILGHAERYSYWYRAFHEYEDLKNREVFFQVNTLSFGGFYNADYRKMAEKLAKLDMIDFLGSDMHRPQQEAGLAQCRKLPVVDHLISSGRLMNSEL